MIEKKFTMNKTAPWHRRMIPPRMSVVPRVKNNGLYLGFLSLLSQTVHSSPTWCEELTYLKRPWCWERLRAGGEGDDRGWDGWMATLTRWTWVWVNSQSCWWTGRPGVLCFMGSQRVRHDWVTEQQQPHPHRGYCGVCLRQYLQSLSISFISQTLCPWSWH